ncbi:VWA domain-containing protein, partial [Mycobacterium sp. E796]|uniref:VWA domain-containing protein n=1 Tax=Mycobacterium sp. E796 TaxID=1834151 RepID=UPI000B0A5351
GFQRPGLLLFGLIPLALLAVYVVVQARRRQRLRRFTEAEVPQSWWRHVPVAVALLSLFLLTVALATPTHDMRIPRNRACVVLIIDMSNSMRATDVEPNRLKAAEQAASQFASQLTPGINLGLVGFAGTPYLLVPPTPQHEATLEALKKLEFADGTATGEAIFTALHAVGAAAITGGDTPPPARIVLESDGAENVPLDPNAPQGAFTAARAAKAEEVQISTISFGTPYGTVEYEGATIPVPVDDQTLQEITKITDGQAFHADSLESLESVYSTLQRQIGYQTVKGDASLAWMLLGAVLLAGAVLAGEFLNRRLPA